MRALEWLRAGRFFLVQLLRGWDLASIFQLALNGYCQPLGQGIYVALGKALLRIAGASSLAGTFSLALAPALAPLVFGMMPRGCLRHEQTY